MAIERIECARTPRQQRDDVDRGRPPAPGRRRRCSVTTCRCASSAGTAARSQPARTTGATLRLVSPDAVRRLMWSPNELGLARAFVAGELEVDGDIFEVVAALRAALESGPRPGLRSAGEVVAAARRLGVLGRPLPPPPEEARLHGGRHSMRRDADAIGHHYDVGNDFYALVLGPSMTYSCARFAEPDTDLDRGPGRQARAGLPQARAARAPRRAAARRRVRLGLDGHPCGDPSRRLGRRHHDLRAAGRRRPASASPRPGSPIGSRSACRTTAGSATSSFDAVSSIGMAEHVGRANLDRYFEILHGVLASAGRLLNHAISKVGGSRIGRRSFIGRYVFPDGELIDVGDSVLAMERAGFEVRDVESLREHYTRTLRSWVANLESHWDDAVALVGARRARVWRLYMAGSAVSFADGSINVHQVLGVVPAADGDSGMPPTRRSVRGSGCRTSRRRASRSPRTARVPPPGRVRSPACRGRARP